MLQYLSKLEECISKTIIYYPTTKDYCIEPSLSNELKKLKDEIDDKYSQVQEIRNDIEMEGNENSRKAKKVKLDE